MEDQLPRTSPLVPFHSLCVFREDAGYKPHARPHVPVVWRESLCQALAETVQIRHSSPPLEVCATTKGNIISDDNIVTRILLSYI